MEHRILGRTGLSVSVLGMGAAHFGGYGLKDESECLRVAHKAFDHGINLIDTADFYGFGKSETITGKAIADRRDKVVLASKCGMPMSTDSNERGGSRHWIHKAVDNSLRRLGTDHIDIYQLHVPDPATEIEETVGSMNDLVQAGKIRYFGTSNFSARMISEAQLRARLSGMTAPHTEQTSYSIFTREPEAELLPACQVYNVGFFAYSPLDGGWLSGKYRQGAAFERSPRQRLQPERFDLDDTENQRKLDAVEQLAALCDEARMPMPNIAVGFVLSHKAVTCALVGGSRPEHYEVYLDDVRLSLNDDELDRIDQIIAPGSTLPRAPSRSPALVDAGLRRRGQDSRSPRLTDATRRVMDIQQGKD